MKIALTVAITFVTCCSLLAQQEVLYDFKTGDIHIQVDPREERIQGQVEYTFNSYKRSDSVYLDARKMQVRDVALNGRGVRYSNDGRYLVIRKKIRPNREYRLLISYACHPDQAVYFKGWKDTIPGNEQVWTQGQGKYNSHWVPSFDLMTEKVRFNLSIEFDKDYAVIANGKLGSLERGDRNSIWKWEMTKPMSSYLLAFAIGKYDHIPLESTTGIPIDMYYYPGDSLLTEPTYRHSAEILDFLEREIGVGFPWQNYKMVPVRDFLYAGMENTGTTFFSDAYMIDSTAFTDRNFISVNAHELAHQWFGNLVTERDASSHWLHEGFANYYAWLAEKEFLGEDHFYWMLYDKMEDLSAQSRGGGGESLLDPAAGSLTFYDKGGLALLMLRESLGEVTFRKTIVDFLSAFSYENARVEDFMNIVETSSGKDVSQFRETWLESTAFPREEVVEFLRGASPAIDSFLALRKELTTSGGDSETIIGRYWDASGSSRFKKRMILLFHRSLSPEFLKKAFDTGDTEVRQALALIPGSIPEELLPDYESLLGDKSYVTLENALYRLWIQYPESRRTYLDRTEGILGFPNKNIRQLWLLLAILTKDYGTAGQKEMYRQELFGYTAPHHPMEVRQLAFGLIGEVFPYTRQNLKDLVNAAVHPSWQFREFGRKILRDQLSNPSQRRQLELILDDLRGDEYRYLLKELDRK